MNLLKKVIEYEFQFQLLGNHENALEKALKNLLEGTPESILEVIDSAPYYGCLFRMLGCTKEDNNQGDRLIIFKHFNKMVNSINQTGQTLMQTQNEK